MKAKVANYDSSLFKQSYTSADYWVNVGWQEYRVGESNNAAR